ncbi:MAG TPA: SDR family oxidoreductase [Burkholderiales bacterium]|nr:SDR family oxidoreductase [Burkholderiales bacterium]
MPTVLITGAGRGLGLEFARQYAADGWKVIATIRRPDAKATLQSLGPDVDVRLADLADRGSIGRLAADLRGVAIDVLINNAGIYGPSGLAIGKLDYAAWEQVLRVNVLGPAAVSEALRDNVAASARRTIVMMSSRLGSIREMRAGDYLYGSSKAALNAVTKAFASALEGRGVVVVALSPGWVRTDMGGTNAPLAPETSIAGMRKVIAGLSRRDSGRFISYDGSDIPW